MQILPEFYQTHLQSQLKPSQYLDLQRLVFLLQSQKQVCLEKLASVFPVPIKFESRRRSLQRFLILPQLNIEILWFPVVTYLLTCYFPKTQLLEITIDRTQWAHINVLMVSLIWQKRALPLYWQLLPKIGCTQLEQKKAVTTAILPLLKGYKAVVLGDREFGTVGFANWLGEQSLSFALRLKKDEYIRQDGQLYQRLDSFGLVPGVSLYFRQVKVTKQKGFGQFNIACKWKRQYREMVADEGWFILTNLESLEAAITAYKHRFGIEEMFKDCKTGGYNLEGSKAAEKRLSSIILLIAIAYSIAIVRGLKIKHMGVQKYVCRVKESGRTERRHSTFRVGLSGEMWVKNLELCADWLPDLMKLNPNKLKHYQRGLRAAELIQSKL